MHKLEILLVISYCILALSHAGLIGRRVITPGGPPPPGPESPAVLVGNTLYVSGQIGMKDGALVPGGAAAEAKQALENIEALLKSAGTDTSKVVKATVMLADIQDYAAVNKVYARHFSKPYPARAAFQVARIPKDAKVEIDVIAIVDTVVDAS